MNFIEGILPNLGFNSFFTCMYKLTKRVIFVPIFIKQGLLTVFFVTQPFFKHVLFFFSMLHIALHDRDPRLTS